MSTISIRRVFIANTYPTRALRNLLANVCQRLGGEVMSIFQRDTSYYGRKSQGLIALCHFARGVRGHYRSLDNIRAVVKSVKAMSHEGAAYWLCMAMHRKHQRRVLTALRFL